MADPSLALQSALYAALTAAPAVANGRVYDRVPAGLTASPPYVTIGEGDVVDDGNSCWDASDVTVQVHVWSDEVGFPAVKRIAAEAVARCKRLLDLEADGFTVVSAQHVQTRYPPPDGLTTHAAIEMRYLIDHHS